MLNLKLLSWQFRTCLVPTLISCLAILIFLIFDYRELKETFPFMMLFYTGVICHQLSPNNKRSLFFWQQSQNRAQQIKQYLLASLTITLIPVFFYALLFLIAPKLAFFPPIMIFSSETYFPVLTIFISLPAFTYMWIRSASAYNGANTAVQVVLAYIVLIIQFKLKTDALALTFYTGSCLFFFIYSFKTINKVELEHA